VKSQDLISILITFAFGMFVGGYLYLTGFAPTYKLPAVEGVDVYGSFVLTGDSYGECNFDGTCLSFQLLSDGTYRVIYDSTGIKDAYDGKITRQLHRQIPTAFTEESLAQQSLPALDPECRYGQEGTNYRFNVNYNNVSYTLDTCGSNIDYDGVTWDYLKNLFNYIATEGY